MQCSHTAVHGGTQLASLLDADEALHLQNVEGTLKEEAGDLLRQVAVPLRGEELLLLLFDVEL